jgi:hypothetical protein
MKKLILTSVCALAATGVAMAQGTVQWTVISPAALTFETNTTVSSPLSGSVPQVGGSIGLASAAAGAFYYELLYNAAGTADPTTLAALDTWGDTGLEGIDSTSAGKVNVVGSTSDATVPFTATSSIIVVGWSSNIGTTWTAAKAALNGGNVPLGTLFGESSTAQFTPNAAGVSPGAVPVGTGGAAQIDSLLTPLYPVVVPEPTTLALGAMGALSLLALRRKKA